ncbi:hypothetical protein [uncultured Pseudacidovorax sp.]|uniref:hypothetical protein n=1 Tax=uncultured Pseudacidovorax sp. TaxID=679313 RepID=UPI0025D958E5|nr:hypothetical protein [uncultured Pseudacidovorax sp.]
MGDGTTPTLPPSEDGERSLFDAMQQLPSTNGAALDLPPRSLTSGRALPDFGEATPAR